jgi:diguanylate cyclase (GGDEF)-like protein
VGTRRSALEDSLRRTLASDDPASFLLDLTNLLQEDELAEKDIHSWQSDLTALVSRLPVIASALPLSGQTAPAKAEELLHRARALVSASVQRQGARSLLEKGRQGERLGRLSSRLISSMLESDILAALAEELPSVGIRGCHVFYFDGPDASTCQTAHGSPTGLRFASRDFPPPGLYPPDAVLSLDLLPLSVQDETLGYTAFDAESPDSLALVAGQLSAAVKTSRLHAEVRSLSLTDALTGLANRRHFDGSLQREFERCQRYNRTISVILADVDLFKSYNDQCGHLAGDEALREIARCFLKATRKEVDVVCRYGGEEFAVILPETNTAGARVVAERIREEVLGSGKFLKPLSVSLGVASMSGGGASRNLLLETADKTLYVAKKKGRNRVEVGECPE